MNPEACAIDEQVDRPICGELLESEIPELLEASGQCRVIGNGKLCLE